MDKTKSVSIDGSYGEGGGQIVRTACALSAVTGTACRIFNIRKNRKNPGLGHQHLIGLRALATLSGAQLEGGTLGSDEIIYHPGGFDKTALNIEIPTAGSITLILQTLLLPAFFAPTPISIDFRGGGTDTFFSPTMDYHCCVFSRILEKIGLRSKITTIKRGFYPKGGAKVRVELQPGKIKNSNCLERGALNKFIIRSGASDDLRNSEVAERQAKSAEERLACEVEFPIEKRVQYHSTLSTGSYICIIAEFENTYIGSDTQGRPGKRAEKVGTEVALQFLKELDSGACLDKYAGDQVIPYLSLAQGKSEFTVSEIQQHTSTNIWIIKNFLNREILLTPNGTKTAIKIL